ncbi:D-alanyl-D-alanine carboxypeptidase family protein [Bacillus thuringiensis]|uniref:D-alanyl-D-alanine carboxypeptidase family protein n=1 Tax=Bacillus thuringiensis TaxID=1428 RepID=UPI0005CE06A1|nr:D-alanyl-D-alanine carboxypeptidase family protein [Bacillus thuringiensis]
MKRLKDKITLFLLIVLFLQVIPHKTQAISASSAILMEQKTGRVLFEKDAFTTRRIASITKIMTAILAVESGKMENITTVSPKATYTEGSSIHLKAGDKIKLKDLVYGLMLRSGNDAAVSIAEYIGGSLEGFIYLMNKKAEEIGMKNTVFSNPHGLDDHENHYSTSYDMALLTRYAQNNPVYKKISSTKVYQYVSLDGQIKQSWINKNKLLTTLYKFSTGGKTGYTKRAKRTLVSTASKNNLNLIAVTLNDAHDWNDHIHMFNQAFNNYEMVEISSPGKIKDFNHPVYENNIVTRQSFFYPLSTEERKNISFKMSKLSPPKTKWRKNKVPHKIGTMYIKLYDNIIGNLPLYYEETTPQER